MTYRNQCRSFMQINASQIAWMLAFVVAWLLLALPAHADSYTETTLFAFPQNPDESTPDGDVPIGLIQGSDGNFYGTTIEGGSGSNFGTVYKITPAGDFTLLHTFTGGVDDGTPFGRLVEGPDHLFYGTTNSGGSGSGHAGTGVQHRFGWHADHAAPVLAAAGFVREASLRQPASKAKIELISRLSDALATSR